MDLASALDDWPASGNNNQSGAAAGGAWPTQPAQPTWPGAPNQPNQPMWPGAPNQPSQPNQPGWPGAPNQPSQPNQPGWPGAPNQPSQPSQPGWPGAPGQGGSWFPGHSPAPGPAPSPFPGAAPGPAPGQAPAPSPFPGPAPSPGQGGWFNPSPGTAAATSLSVPYSQKFPNGLRDGSVINIAGTIKSGANKVTVDVFTARDLAFHFNLRFNEAGKKVIVRNSKIGGRWGAEERQLPHFPFVAGQPFQMRFECTSHMFKVFVNGSHLLDFKHRTGNIRDIQKLDIYNDLTLSNVSVQ
ncbi:galectin-3b isoform X1 [Stigmatopora argus]